MIYRRVILALLMFLCASAPVDGQVQTDSSSLPDTSAYRSEDVVLPPNVLAADGMKHILISMLKRSATFRHQCQIIKDKPHVRITLKLVPPEVCSYRAFSTVKKYEGGLITISMHLIAPSDYVEMIGHEFEHALEQIEGKNLRTLALIRKSGVYQVAEGTFETTRAYRVGRKVASEYYGW